jgi:hypothetical protein
MFEKLFLLVKNNAGEAVINNPAIAENNREAALNDASSSIIEVLKSHMESGKIKDLVKYFQFTGIFNNPLITSAVKKYANKLNNFYGIESKEAMEISKKLITPVMQELISQSKGEQNKEFALNNIITKLSGNIGNISMLLNPLKLV